MKLLSSDRERDTKLCIISMEKYNAYEDKYLAIYGDNIFHPFP
jgi:hypothetical protein